MSTTASTAAIRGSCIRPSLGRRACAIVAVVVAGAISAAPALADTHEQMMEGLGHSDWGHVRSSLARRASGDAGAKARTTAKVRKPAAAKQLAAASEETPKRRARGRQVASLGPSSFDITEKPKVSGGISWVASASCLASSLRGVISEVAASFGALRVSSTCRSHKGNRRAGGAPKSYHLSGQAADFRVFGSVGAVYAFLRGHGSVGGLKHYGGGLFHIDTGPRRPF